MKKAFTLIEVMIVIGIVSLLFIALLMSMSGQRGKADDAKIKGDLERLKIAFEDYYNDNNCYPPAAWFDSQADCGSGNLSPYLNAIPCDKKTGVPYRLEYPDGQCSSFKLFAVLEKENDPDALSSPYTAGGVTYHYGVGSSNVTLDGGGTSDPSHNYYWCSAVGNCTYYDPSSNTCTPSYTDDANCGGSAYSKCPSAGHCTPK